MKSELFDYPDDIEMFDDFVDDHRITVIGMQLESGSAVINTNGPCFECGEPRMNHKKLKILWGYII